MILKKTTREEFKNTISNDIKDNFAKTFVAKCNFMDCWEDCIGCWDKNELMGAIVVTYSKRKPKIANLQLLHTFAKHRKKGVAHKLCKELFEKAKNDNCEYFRVSSEPDAVNFYRKIGFKFQGKQKSGTYLSLFKIVTDKIKDGIYEGDTFIEKRIRRKGKGKIVEFFEVIE